MANRINHNPNNQFNFNNSSPIRCLQVNLGKGRNAFQEIHKIIHSSYDFIFFQEPHLNNNHRITNIPGFTIYQFPAPNHTEHPLKAAIAIRNNICSTLGNTEHSNSNLASVHIQTTKGIKIILTSVYIEPRTDDLQTLRRLEHLLQSTIGSLHIICGDFNGWNTLWGSNSNNRRGNQILDLIFINNLTVCNTGNRPTFETVTHGIPRESIIDLTLTTGSKDVQIIDWHVDSDLCPSSDHNAISFNLKIEKAQLIKNKKLSTFKYNTYSLKWDNIKEEFKHEIELNLPAETNITTLDKQGLDKYINLITSAIQKTCNKVLPKATRYSHKAPWWNDELDTLKRKVLQNHRELRKRKRRALPLEDCLRVRYTLRKEYSDAICSASHEHFKEFCTTQKNEDVWTVTNKIIKAKPISQPPATLKLDNGKFTNTTEETAEALLNKFYPDDTPDTSDYQKSLTTLMQQPIHTPPEPPFTETEVIECIKYMNPKKSPGPDNLTSDICYQFTILHPEIMTNIFNRCLELGYFPKSWKIAYAKIIPKPNKSDYTSLAAYRPIGLINVFGKLLEKLVINRLTHHSHTNNYICDQQFGFKLQTSTTDAIRSALTTINTSISQKEHVIAASLDIKSAFDNAWWPSIFKKLRDIQCPSNIFYILRDYVKERNVFLNFADCSLNKGMTKGCIQGSVCGPSLWNLILDQLLAIDLPEGCRLQAYADDVLLISSHQSISSLERNTNIALKTISDWGKSVKLDFGPDKTTVVPFTNKSKLCKINIDHKFIPFSNHLKYLGIIIDSKQRFIKHSEYIIEKAKKLFNKLMVFIKPTWGIHPDNVKIIYLRVIEPIICYGASIWAKALQYQYIRDRFLSLQRLFSIKIIQGFRTISTAASISIAQLNPLPSKIQSIADIETTKFTGVSQYLPTDIPIERRAQPNSFLHPSHRLPISFNEIKTTEEFDIFRSDNYNNHLVFTDGSKIEDKVGSAFIIFKPNGNNATNKYKLHNCCSVFQAELIAINNAVKYIFKQKIPTTNIFSDCKSALLEISNPNSQNFIVNEIHHTLHSARLQNLEIYFSWVKAHINILGNEMADAAAKSAAFSHKSPEYNSVPISHIKQINKEKLNQDSIDLYNKTSAHIKTLFPTYNNLCDYLKSVRPVFEITQLLTNHGYHKEYLHRFKITENENCPCDNNTTQSLKHLIEECPRFARSRLEHIIVSENFRIDSFNLNEITEHQSTCDSYHKHLFQIINNLKDFNKTNTNTNNNIQPH